MLGARNSFEESALQTDPLAGDKGDDGYKPLTRRIVTARTGGTCSICAGLVSPGSRIRVDAGILDGRACSERFCQPCTQALAKWANGHEGALLARDKLGYRRRAAIG
jgi:hypothetical protein